MYWNLEFNPTFKQTKRVWGMLRKHNNKYENNQYENNQNKIRRFMLTDKHVKYVCFKH